mgnify:FL=1
MQTERQTPVLEALGITKRYQNTDMEICVEEILRDLDK